MGFVGLVCTTQINMQILGDALRLDRHSSDATQWKAIARHLGALRIALGKLQEVYRQDIFNIGLQLGPLATYFPVYRDFRTLEGRDITVSYSLQPFPRNLLFYGTCVFEEGGKEVEVCVKFVTQYSFGAHQFCASEQFAPQIFAFVDLGGGWKVVVMERLDQSFDLVTALTLKPELYELLKEKLSRLHQNGDVHGDVRDVNIMAKEENGRYSVKLLDFDWAGRIGEVRYPRNVRNSPSLRRPREAYSGELIQAEHDIKMLDHIFQNVVGSRGSWWTLEPSGESILVNYS
jgi:hypothetical protein